VGGSADCVERTIVALQLKTYKCLNVKLKQFIFSLGSYFYSSGCITLIGDFTR
jgi:hypothetical protein